MTMMDTDTKDWIRTAADEKAAAAGMVFDGERGEFACNWMEKYLYLYEGEAAGQRLELLPHWLDFFMRLYGWVRWSEEWSQWIRRFTKASFWGGKKNGKALCLETEVPTPNGFRRFGDLAHGDELFDETGTVCSVTGITEVFHNRPCFEVEFSDGTKVVADQNHLWRVESFRDDYRSMLLTTGQICKGVDVTNSHGESWAKNYRIAVAGSIQTNRSDLPISPYTLGAWLGDGDSDCSRITTADSEVLVGIAAEGIVVGRKAAQRGLAGRYRIGGEDGKGRGRGTSLTAVLRKNGLLKNKHIPESYLFAHENDRLALLKGLMDTDGTISKAGQCSFVTIRPQLASDVKALVASLGWKPTVKTKRARCQTGATRVVYQIQFWATPDRPCFTIARKVARLRPAKAKRTRAMTRHIVSVKPVPSVPVRCISVSSPSQLFLVTRSYIATHNSPMCSAHNLYMLCGDGEKGQKVYQAAANGEQAKIPQMHSINMVKQSPELLEVCKINNSTLQITHLPSSSFLAILSGDDSRGARAKEGLNGSVSYDEMHVVNREMEERTSRAGISRKEPINISFSTAGDDPSSVGYQRYTYGKQVNAGERNDLHFLHVEYAAPENVTEASIDEKLEEYGKMANPAWGTLIKPSEFRSDWERSKGIPREVARFKQYRINIWVGSTNQWLDTFGWEQGQREFTLDDLRGRDCFLGIDLSRTRDMTAATLLFPWPEDGAEVSNEDGSERIDAVRLWPMFWLPEQTAKDRDHLFPYRTWSQDGHITLTKGSVVDYRAVEEGVRDAVAKYNLNILGIFFDQTYAEELTQRLVDGDGKVEGFGCERTAVGQGVMSLTSLAKEFERRVSIGLIQHPGNAVMTWQVGHVEVWTDKNQNIRPVKPTPHSGKSIDGIMAALDAMAGVLSYAGSTSGGFEVW